MKVPFHIHSALAKKGEIKMERMNLFTNKREFSEASFENTKPKGDIKPRERKHSEDFKNLAIKLAEKIGVEAAADELNISVNTLLTWNHTLAKSLSSPIQDDCNLTFTLEGKTYSLNVNSKEERERVKQEVNANSLTKYDWFKEEMGEQHWVLYNTEIYEIEHTAIYWKFYLHYKENSGLTPITPINATSCHRMFSCCSNLKSLDIRNFDTSSVIDMRYMFSGCSKLTSLDFTGFDTSQVINMKGMFDGCSSLTFLDLGSFDTNKVTNMRDMFAGCSSLISLNLSKFNTSNVTDMGAMFNDCSKLTVLDLSNFNTSKVTDMGWMLSDCSNLTLLDISNFNTSNVTNMYAMFNSCSSITLLDLSNFNTSKVNTMSLMFGGCKSLTKLDLSNFDISKVIVMFCMFEHCNSLTSIYISDKWKTNSRVDSFKMFEDCHSLSNFNQEKTDAEMAKPVEQGGYLTLKR